MSSKDFVVTTSNVLATASATVTLADKLLSLPKELQLHIFESYFNKRSHTNKVYTRLALNITTHNHRDMALLHACPSLYLKAFTRFVNEHHVVYVNVDFGFPLLAPPPSTARLRTASCLSGQFPWCNFREDDEHWQNGPWKQLLNFVRWRFLNMLPTPPTTLIGPRWQGFWHEYLKMLPKRIHTIIVELRSREDLVCLNRYSDDLEGCFNFRGLNRIAPHLKRLQLSTPAVRVWTRLILHAISVRT